MPFLENITKSNFKADKKDFYHILSPPPRRRNEFNTPFLGEIQNLSGSFCRTQLSSRCGARFNKRSSMCESWVGISPGPFFIISAKSTHSPSTITTWWKQQRRFFRWQHCLSVIITKIYFRLLCLSVCTTRSV